MAEALTEQEIAALASAAFKLSIRSVIPKTVTIKKRHAEALGLTPVKVAQRNPGKPAVKIKGAVEQESMVKVKFAEFKAAVDAKSKTPAPS